MSDQKQHPLAATITGARKKMLLIMGASTLLSMNIEDPDPDMDYTKEARFARSWMGEVKGVLKIGNRYEVVNKSKDLKPLIDTPSEDESKAYMEHLKKITGSKNKKENLLALANYLRKELDDVLAQWEANISSNIKFAPIVSKYIMESRMRLGFVLEHVRDGSKK